MLTGLDLVARDGSALLDGRRIGLVVHGASVTAEGEHAIDVFLRRQYHLVRLFSPEHGLRGSAAAGEAMEDAIDPGTGLPIISFYGPRTAPEPEHLAGLDVLVIDLQDVGVRFYTYSSTMLRSADAALRAGVDVIILDRPNPLGGDRTSGPLREESVPVSMVSRAPGPLVHGLTLGEMARFVLTPDSPESADSANSGELVGGPGGGSEGRREVARGKLDVITMEGWRRAMRWRDTGLPWTPPSPNLRTPQAAALYPATALVEATNVSEGRGTESPFLIIGAPFVSDVTLKEVRRVLSAVGVESKPLDFTPLSSAAAPSPKAQGELCHGLVLDPGRADFDQYALGLEILRAFASDDGFEMLREGRALTWLLGNEAASEVLLGDLNLAEHLREVDAANRQWLQHRSRALLYR